MLALALDPRFKHLSFVDEEEAKTKIYREIKAKIVAWTMTRQRTLSAAGGASTSTGDVPSTSSAISSPTHITDVTLRQSRPLTPARKKVHDMFSCLTKARTTTNNNNSNCYDKVKADVANQFTCFLDKPILDFADNPLSWWRSEANRYPALEIGVRKLFYIPATRAPFGRVFSSAGNIVDKKRASLLPRNVDMLVFMYTNKHLF